jgi:hypothetical protein
VLNTLLGAVQPNVAWLVLIVLVILYLVRRINSDKSHSYDIADILIDTVTGKASLDKHVLLLMALLSAWAVVVLVVKGQPVETLLLGVLGIFVLQRGVHDGITAFKGKTNGAEPDK